MTTRYLQKIAHIISYHYKQGNKVKWLDDVFLWVPQLKVKVANEKMVESLKEEKRIGE